MAKHHPLYERMQKLEISLNDVGRIVGRSPSTIHKQLTDATPLKPYVEDAVKVAIAQRMAEQDGSTAASSTTGSSTHDVYLAAVAEKLRELGGTVLLEVALETQSGHRRVADLVYRTSGPVPRETVFELKMRPRPEFRVASESEPSTAARSESEMTPKARMIADLEAKLLAVETVELLLESHDLTDIEELKAVLLRQRDKVKQHRSVLDEEAEDEDETPGNSKRADATEPGGRTAR